MLTNHSEGEYEEEKPFAHVARQVPNPLLSFRGTKTCQPSPGRDVLLIATPSKKLVFRLPSSSVIQQGGLCLDDFSAMVVQQLRLCYRKSRSSHTVFEVRSSGPMMTFEAAAGSVPGVFLTQKRYL